MADYDNLDSIKGMRDKWQKAMNTIVTRDLNWAKAETDPLKKQALETKAQQRKTQFEGFQREYNHFLETHANEWGTSKYAVELQRQKDKGLTLTPKQEESYKDAFFAEVSKLAHIDIATRLGRGGANADEMNAWKDLSYELREPWPEAALKQVWKRDKAAEGGSFFSGINPVGVLGFIGAGVLGTLAFGLQGISGMLITALIGFAGAWGVNKAYEYAYPDPAPTPSSTPAGTTPAVATGAAPAAGTEPTKSQAALIAAAAQARNQSPATRDAVLKTAPATAGGFVQNDLPLLQFASYLDYRRGDGALAEQVTGTFNDKYFVVIGKTRDNVQGTNEGHPIIATCKGDGTLETICIVDEAAPDKLGNAELLTSYGLDVSNPPRKLQFTNGKLDFQSTMLARQLLLEWDRPDRFGNTTRNANEDLKVHPVKFQSPEITSSYIFPANRLVPPPAPAPETGAEPVVPWTPASPRPETRGPSAKPTGGVYI